MNWPLFLYALAVTGIIVIYREFIEPEPIIILACCTALAFVTFFVVR